MSVAAAAVAASVARARREVAQALRDSGALSEAAAAPYQPASNLQSRVLHQMIRRGAVHQTASGALWLDEAALAAQQAAARRNALIAITLVFVVAAVVAVIGYAFGMSK